MPSSGGVEGSKQIFSKNLEFKTMIEGQNNYYYC